MAISIFFAVLGIVLLAAALWVRREWQRMGPPPWPDLTPDPKPEPTAKPFEPPLPLPLQYLDLSGATERMRQNADVAARAFERTPHPGADEVDPFEVAPPARAPHRFRTPRRCDECNARPALPAKQLSGRWLCRLCKRRLANAL